MKLWACVLFTSKVNVKLTLEHAMKTQGGE